MLSYTMYTTVDPTTAPPVIHIEERGRRLHNNTSTSSSSSTYASDEEDDHIEPLQSNSRRGSILNYVYGLTPTHSASNSRASSRTRSRSRSRSNIKTHDDPAATLFSLAKIGGNNNLAAPPSPKQSLNVSSRRSSVELREDYAELLEERSRPSSRVNSRSNSRVRAPHPHSHPHEHPVTKDTNNKDKKDPCGSDCATCGNCNTIKDTVLELDDNSPGKIPLKYKYPRRKSDEVTGPYGSTVDVEDEEVQEAKDKDINSNKVDAPSSDSIEQKLGFDMSLLSF
ncbi:hypothetical protein BGW39_007928 [Mortierella sp. 14UC]|nr:hypothetical protein BGW39_007928 [Mortierella sp. 14UC]